MTSFQPNEMAVGGTTTTTIHHQGRPPLVNDRSSGNNFRRLRYPRLFEESLRPPRNSAKLENGRPPLVQAAGRLLCSFRGNSDGKVTQLQHQPPPPPPSNSERQIAELPHWMPPSLEELSQWWKNTSAPSSEEDHEYSYPTAKRPNPKGFSSDSSMEDDESSSLPDVTSCFEILSRSTIRSHRSAVCLKNENAKMFKKSFSNQIKAQFGTEYEKGRRRSSRACLVAWRDDHDQCQSDGALDENSEENDRESEPHSICTYPRVGGGGRTRQKKFKKRRGSRIVLKDWRSDGEDSLDERDENEPSFRAMFHAMNQKDVNKGNEQQAMPEYVTLTSQKNHKKDSENQTKAEYATLTPEKDENKSNQHKTMPEYVTLPPLKDDDKSNQHQTKPEYVTIPPQKDDDKGNQYQLSPQKDDVQGKQRQRSPQKDDQGNQLQKIPEYVTLPPQKNEGNQHTMTENVTLPPHMNQNNQHTRTEYVTLPPHMKQNNQNKNIKEKPPPRRAFSLDGNSTETIRGGHDNQTKIKSDPYMKEDVSLRWWAMRYHFTG